MDTYRLLLFLHLVGASVWVGGHLVLALSVLPKALREKSPEEIQNFESRFERIGLPALVIQVFTGVILALRWAPNVGSWLAPGPGRWIAVKLVLLAITVGFAAHARLRIIPSLSAERLGVLAWHIRAVTVVSLAFVAAGVLLRTGASL